MKKESPMAKVKKAGGKMKPMSMKEYESSSADKKADAKALKKINQKRGK